VPVQLPESWELLLYTDGLIEGRMREGGSERLGTARLVDLVSDRDAALESGEQLIERLIATARELNGGDLTDDVAVLVLAMAAHG
jgi:serine phosphatase RsbU (regulator of sigma subunit)